MQYNQITEIMLEQLKKKYAPQSAVLKELSELNPIGICSINEKIAIYSTSFDKSPNIVRLIGLLREQAFRAAGVGTGKDMDLDEYDDTVDQKQQQMFIVDTDTNEIKGGYRYSYNTDVPPRFTPMGKHFAFTKEFGESNMIQLGRSFVTHKYQNSKSVLYLMHGLGCLFARTQNCSGFYGKITISADKASATNTIVSYCRKHWKSGHIYGSSLHEQETEFEDLVISDKRPASYDNLVELLVKNFSLSGLPILKIYDSLAIDFASMAYLGSFVHHDFGESTEIGMVIHADDIKSKIKKAYIKPYLGVMLFESKNWWSMSHTSFF